VSSTLQSWKQRERQVIDGQFPLRQYLGGSERSAVFATERGKPQPKKAAIKLVPVAAAVEGQLARWQAAAKLSHPNLLRLFESGRCQFDNEAYLYVVMEYAEEDLSQIVPTRALSATEANDMLPPVLESLRYLHRQGLVHGHLKPSNVMAINDTLKLSSDGISRAGEIIGESAAPSVYDAPEAGKTARSAAGDVWSLGMTLVEILTQRPPLREGTEGEPLLPQTMPAPFREIAGQCLRRDPEKRWTLDQIQERLRPGTSKPSLRLVSSASRPGSGDEVPTPKKWRRLVVAGLVLLVAIFVVLKFFGRRGENASAPPTQATVVEGEGGSTAGSSAGIPAKPGGGTSARGSKQPTSSFNGAPSGGGGGGSAIVEQVEPDISRGARNTVQGTIKVNVRVSVDSSGNVTDARFERRGPSDYFARKAMEAARKWKFAANAPRTWVLHFEFRRSGARVIPQPEAS
jgi:eukaryotic-like serine/threonine-protein kinase